MSCDKNTPNVNKTFIIEPLSVTGSTVLSGCSGVYTNQIISCSGDTTISLGTGLIYFNNNIDVNGSISGNTLYSNDIYSGSTNLLDIFSQTDFYVTGGTLTGNTLQLDRNDNNSVNIDLTDIRFSGGSGNCISDLYVTNIYGCSPVTVHDPFIALSGITLSGTPSNDNTLTEIIARDSSTGEFKYRDVASIISAATSQDTYLTGNTFINDTLTSTLNDGSTVTTVINTFNSLSATTMSAGTLTTGGITTSGDIIPTTDNTFVIGTPIKRFREVNTVSGTSSYWKSTTVSATTIDLGLDSSGNTRIINANNSIIKNDCLDGGTY